MKKLLIYVGSAALLASLASPLTAQIACWTEKWIDCGTSQTATPENNCVKIECDSYSECSLMTYELSGMTDCVDESAAPGFLGCTTYYGLKFKFDYDDPNSEWGCDVYAGTQEPDFEECSGATTAYLDGDTCSWRG